ncbi:MAG: alginate lyase family protein [Armatimonadetes bacterium]|nr:alginate lyase family protein [Armatimonadota bacterium]
MRQAVLTMLFLCATLAWSQEKTWNAASPRYGATATVIKGPDIHVNGSTPIEDCFDGNAHSRMVVTGTPYTFRIELMDRFPIARVAFAHSDYAGEQAAKDIEVRLDDGTVIPIALEPRANPVPRGLKWQEFPVGRPAKVVEITVKANHPGTVGWGAVGDIALLTTTDLDARLAVPDYDPKSPTFVTPPSFAAGTAAPVTLPPRAAKDVWPRGFLTPAELTGLKAELAKPRGQEALALLIARADGAAAITPEFPDPKGPGAQLKDRGDDLAKQHSKLAYDCGTLGMAYALTGEKRYLDGARARLLGYAQRYVDYPKHTGANRNDLSKVMAQRLSEAMWLIPQIAAYDYCHDALTAAERESIEQGLIRPAVEMVRNRQPATEVADRTRSAADWRTRDPFTGESKILGNWTNFYALATVLAGATLQDQDYIDLAAAELRENIALGIGSDGMWGEGAIGYQFFALQAMIPAMDIAARHGVDLWSYRDNRAKMLFDSPLRYVYPDGTGAGINDSGRAKLGNWSTMVYDYAWLRWHDPRHAVMRAGLRHAARAPGRQLPQHGVRQPGLCHPARSDQVRVDGLWPPRRRARPSGQAQSAALLG